MCEGPIAPSTYNTIRRQLPTVIVRKVVGQHLILNIIPKKFTTETGRKVWCDWRMRCRSHQAIPTPSVGISGCNNKKMMGHHLFLNIIPNNFMARTERERGRNRAPMSHLGVKVSYTTSHFYHIHVE